MPAPMCSVQKIQLFTLSFYQSPTPQGKLSITQAAYTSSSQKFNEA